MDAKNEKTKKGNKKDVEGVEGAEKVITISEAELQAKIQAMVEKATATAVMADRVSRFDSLKREEQISLLIAQNAPIADIISHVESTSEWVSWASNINPAVAETAAALSLAKDGDTIQTPLGDLTVSFVERSYKDRDGSVRNWTEKHAECEVPVKLVHTIQTDRNTGEQKNSMAIEAPFGQRASGNFIRIFRVREANNFQGWSGSYGQERRPKRN